MIGCSSNIYIWSLGFEIHTSNNTLFDSALRGAQYIYVLRTQTPCQLQSKRSSHIAYHELHHRPLRSHRRAARQAAARERQPFSSADLRTAICCQRGQRARPIRRRRRSINTRGPSSFASANWTTSRDPHPLDRRRGSQGVFGKAAYYQGCACYCWRGE